MLPTKGPFDGVFAVGVSVADKVGVDVGDGDGVPATTKNCATNCEGA
jgi:hypothetical protein